MSEEKEKQDKIEHEQPSQNPYELAEEIGRKIRRRKRWEIEDIARGIERRNAEMWAERRRRRF